MKTIIAFLLTAGMVAAALETQKPGTSDQTIPIGTHRLQIHCEGRGSPTVILDAGLGDPMEKLKSLQQRIAEVTLVCAYNRAGYGNSEAGPLPRDCSREAEELKALLEGASMPGPYVVVGHSLGAIISEVFAAKFPRDIVGIVLLDPPPLSFIRRETYPNLLALADRMTAEWQAMADSGAKSTDAQERSRANFFRMIASEHREMFGQGGNRVAEISSFGNIPLLVMAAGKANPLMGDVAEEYQRYWIEQSRVLSQKSSKGRFVLVEKSSHYLYVDAPDLVAESILSMVRQFRTT